MPRIHPLLTSRAEKGEAAANVQPNPALFRFFFPLLLDKRSTLLALAFCSRSCAASVELYPLAAHCWTTHLSSTAWRATCSVRGSGSESEKAGKKTRRLPAVGLTLMSR